MIRACSKSSKFARFLAVVLVLIFAIGIIPASAATTLQTVTVSTKKQLVAAMKNPEVGTIIYETDKSTGFIIPSVEGAENKKLIINAPNVKLYNDANFKNIIVTDCNKFSERASGNSFTVKDDNAKIVIAKGAEVEKLTLSSNKATVTVKEDATIDNVVCYKANAIVNIKAGADTSVNVTVKKTANINISGNIDSEISITNNAKNTFIESTVPVVIDANKKINVTLNEGSEGSSISTNENVKVKVENNTTEDVKVTKGEEGSVIITAAPTATSVITAVPTATTVPTTKPTAIATPTATAKPEVTDAPIYIPVITSVPAPVVTPYVSPTSAPVVPTATTAPTATPAATAEPTVTATPTVTAAPTATPTQAPIVNEDGSIRVDNEDGTYDLIWVEIEDGNEIRREIEKYNSKTDEIISRTAKFISDYSNKWVVNEDIYSIDVSTGQKYNTFKYFENDILLNEELSIYNDAKQKYELVEATEYWYDEDDEFLYKEVWEHSYDDETGIEKIYYYLVELDGEISFSSTSYEKSFTDPESDDFIRLVYRYNEDDSINSISYYRNGKFEKTRNYNYNYLGELSSLNDYINEYDRDNDIFYQYYTYMDTEENITGYSKRIQYTEKESGVRIMEETDYDISHNITEERTVKSGLLVSRTSYNYAKEEEKFVLLFKIVYEYSIDPETGLDVCISEQYDSDGNLITKNKSASKSFVDPETGDKMLINIKYSSEYDKVTEYYRYRNNQVEYSEQYKYDLDGNLVSKNVNSSEMDEDTDIETITTINSDGNGIINYKSINKKYIDESTGKYAYKNVYLYNISTGRDWDYEKQEYVPEYYVSEVFYDENGIEAKCIIKTYSMDDVLKQHKESVNELDEATGDIYTTENLYRDDKLVNIYKYKRPEYGNVIYTFNISEWSSTDQDGNIENGTEETECYYDDQFRIDNAISLKFDSNKVVLGYTKDKYTYSVNESVSATGSAIIVKHECEFYDENELLDYKLISVDNVIIAEIKYDNGREKKAIYYTSDNQNDYMVLTEYDEQGNIAQKQYIYYLSSGGERHVIYDALGNKISDNIIE